jgi:hypothetical protein
MTILNDSYLPVPWDFREVLDDEIKREKDGVIYYFTTEPDMEKAEGKIAELLQTSDGEFLLTSKGHRVRLDKIVTLYGKPGPSYHIYDGYANVCLNTHKDNC